MNRLVNYAKRLLPKSKKIVQKKEFVFPFVLVSLCLVILFLNHIPGTILSGWDTLHPEFNFSLNFERLIFGVWREEQGLGAVAAHAHMADIPRVLLLWISSFFVSLSNLRFLYIGANLVLGVLGVYFFVKKAVLRNAKYAEIFGFLGALFYLFNLGTVQQFYVPFEMFTTQYGLLPWLVLLAVKYLENPSIKYLAVFGIVTFLAAPMAYAPLLWYAYFGSLIFFLLPFLKSQKRQVLKLLLVTLLVNLFWIIPNLYFLISGNAALIPEAKINKIFSEEAYMQNASFSHFSDVVIFKNFLFNWPVYAGFDRFNYLLLSWRQHIANPYVLGVLYFNFVVVLVGVLTTIKRRQKSCVGLLLGVLFCLTFLLSDTMPFSLVSSLIRDNFSIIREAFRFPFTKFAIIVMFGFSVFFAVGVQKMFELITSLNWLKLHLRKVLALLTAVFLINFLVIGYPMFKGELISKLMQVKIPVEYFQLFDYLNQQPNSGRVAVLPAHSMWGWVYYDWGFQGAQFITFGIKQPVLDRDWDRWNPTNEQFYREFSYAVYSQNSEILKSVLEKYNVKYLVLDKNIIDPGGENFNQKILYHTETELLLDSLSDQIKEKKEFGGIKVYAFDGKNSGPVSFPTQLSEQTIRKNLDFDQKFLLSKDYLTLAANQSGIDVDNLNLVRSLQFDSQNFSQLGEYEGSLPFKIYLKKDGGKILVSLVLTYLEDNPENGYKLEFKDISGDDLLLNLGKYQTLELKNVNQSGFSYQGIGWLNTKQFSNVAVYRNSESSAKTLPLSVFKTSNFDRTTPGIVKAEYPIDLCGRAEEDQIFGAEFSESGEIKVAAKNSAACVWVPLDKVLDSTNFSTNFKDLFSLSFNTTSNENIFGRFCLYDMTRRRCVKEQKYLLNNNVIKEYFLTENEELEKLSLVFYLDGKSNGKLEEIKYSNIKLSVNSAQEVKSLSPQDLINYISNLNGQNNRLDLQSFELGTKVDLFEAGHSKNECNNLTDNLAFRDGRTDKGFVEYHSKLGSYCDYYSFPNLSHTSGYLLKVKSENVSGLPLRLCLANPYNKRCDVYTVLPKEKGEYLVLVPPLKDGGVGYDIHFDNYAVGNFETVNRIYSLELLPIPYYFMNRMNSNQTDLIKNEMQLTGQEMIMPGVYVATISDNRGGRKIATLDQSYEDGWWAYGAKHLVINGWKNGFEIEDDRGQLVIIYWPEILGLIAELISFSLVICFMIQVLKNRNLFANIVKQLSN